ncbi:hypothetical protein SDC9_157099 [bioreactor metagenome]|uniref:Uncharacterized protein n=1 Tax=bioreactor metagenome TaxID=1076179 RepID=A0A645F6J8_9ZZZZ
MAVTRRPPTVKIYNRYFAGFIVDFHVGHIRRAKNGTYVNDGCHEKERPVYGQKNDAGAPAPYQEGRDTERMSVRRTRAAAASALRPDRTLAG